MVHNPKTIQKRHEKLVKRFPETIVYQLVHLLDEDPIIRRQVLNHLGDLALEARYGQQKIDAMDNKRKKSLASMGSHFDLPKEARTIIRLIPRFIKILRKDPFPGNKYEAAVVLGHLGDEAALPALVEELEKTEDRILRLYIISALGGMGSPKALPILNKIKEADEDEKIRKEAEESIKRITDPEGYFREWEEKEMEVEKWLDSFPKDLNEPF